MYGVFLLPNRQTSVLAFDFPLISGGLQLNCAPPPYHLEAEECWSVLLLPWLVISKTEFA